MGISWLGIIILVVVVVVILLFTLGGSKGSDNQ